MGTCGSRSRSEPFRERQNAAARRARTASRKGTKEGTSPFGTLSGQPCLTAVTATNSLRSLFLVPFPKTSLQIGYLFPWGVSLATYEQVALEDATPPWEYVCGSSAKNLA